MKHYFISGIAFLIILITAVNSVGYYQADEHFQILEFANYKLGNTDAGKLAWEFKAEIRPALQPALAVVLIKASSIMEINNPFNQAMLSCFFCLLFLYRQFFKTNLNLLYYILLFFSFWFVPFVFVRFSSETWSGLFFWLAVGWYMHFKNKKLKHYFLTGVLLGFSFLFRYQVAFMILGFGLWKLFIQKDKFKYLLVVASAFLLTFLLGIVVDYWFYGHFVSTAYNYFKVNIIDDVASTFGVSPWWYYLRLVLYHANAPHGILVLLVFFIFIFKNPKHIFTWVCIPFVLIHSAIPHKEARFLFPLMWCLPVMFLLIMEKLPALASGKGNNLKRIKRIAVIILILNLPLMGIAMFVPANFNIYAISYLQKEALSKKIMVYYTGRDPANPFGLPVVFYFNDSKGHFYDSQKINNINEIDINNENQKIILITNKMILDKNQHNINLKTIYESRPWYAVKYFNFNNWVSRSKINCIYEINRD